MDSSHILRFCADVEFRHGLLHLAAVPQHDASGKGRESNSATTHRNISPVGFRHAKKREAALQQMRRGRNSTQH